MNHYYSKNQGCAIVARFIPVPVGMAKITEVRKSDRTQSTR
jgi:hypothetical protein